MRGWVRSAHEAVRSHGRAWHLCALGATALHRAFCLLGPRRSIRASPDTSPRRVCVERPRFAALCSRMRKRSRHSTDSLDAPGPRKTEHSPRWVRISAYWCDERETALRAHGVRAWLRSVRRRRRLSGISRGALRPSQIRIAHTTRSASSGRAL
eukprot:3017105-Prymnesium_polylepis.1